MPDSRVSKFLGHGYVIQVWPVQSDGQVWWGLLRKVSLPHKRVQSRKAAIPCYLSWLWGGVGCLTPDVMELLLWPSAVLPPNSSIIWGDASSYWSCFKLGFCFAAVNILIDHPDTLWPMWAISLIHSGNFFFHPKEYLKRSSPHPVYSEHRWGGTTRPGAHPLVNDLCLAASLLEKTSFKKERYRFYLCTMTCWRVRLFCN